MLSRSSREEEMPAGGATVVGLRFPEGVVLAGERKATYGSLVLTVHHKKVFLVDERLALGFAGLIAEVQSVLRMLQEELRYYSLVAKTRLSVEGTAKLLSRILYSYRYFPMFSEVLVGGIDNDQPKLLVLDPLGSTLSDDFAAIGTGAPIAIGVLEEGYKSDLDEGEARELALRAVRAALKRDALSGGIIDVIRVTKRGAFEERVGA
ncbi:MAG: hypothetical protein QW405_01400 [Fervidicoccaceae archaeon]